MATDLVCVVIQPGEGTVNVLYCAISLKLANLLETRSNVEESIVIFFVGRRVRYRWNSSPVDKGVQNKCKVKGTGMNMAKCRR